MSVSVLSVLSAMFKTIQNSKLQLVPVYEHVSKDNQILWISGNNICSFFVHLQKHYLSLYVFKQRFLWLTCTMILIFWFWYMFGTFPLVGIIKKVKKYQTLCQFAYILPLSVWALQNESQYFLQHFLCLICRFIIELSPEPQQEDSLKMFEKKHANL